MRRRLLLLGLTLAASASPAPAFDLLEDTYLTNVVYGSKLSEVAGRLRLGGFELSDGAPQWFDQWYRSRWTEMRVEFMTQLSQGVGVIWGVSTGERGEKYEIRPGIKLGLLLQTEPTPQSAFAVTFTHVFNGRLRERPCSADYGAIGGVQDVNCRLAATTLDPAETLQHLLRLRPPDHTYVGLKFRFSF